MRVLLLCFSTLLSATGCSSGSEDAAYRPAAGNGGGGSGPVAEDLPTKLAFRDTPRTLVPRQQLKLTVQTSPPGRYPVRFALPTSSDHEPLDAVLAGSAVMSDDAGNASVILIAPSTGATFKVRASVGGSITAEVELTVVDAGTVTVQVQPVYATATPRDITTWVASAFVDETCADRPSIPSSDGPIVGLAGKQEAPELAGVPAGVPVAITLRSGHFVSGCASVEMFPPGPEGRRHVVEVTVLNRPIELEQSRLALAFGIEAEDEAFRELNAAASRQALVALLGSSTSDADALLDGMRSPVQGPARQSFDSARRVEAWDDLVRSHWGGTGNRLQETVAAWLATADLRLASSPPFAQANITPVDASSAELRLVSIAGLTPSQAGFVGRSLVTWSAKADDTISLSTDLYVSGTRLVTGLAEPAARAAFPAASSAPEALALALECGSLAALLTATGSDSLLAYDDCAEACLGALCEQAAAALWQRAREAGSTSPAHLAVTAAGQARVGDAAEVAGLNGSWVGKLTNVTAPTGGALIGTTSVP